MPVSQGVSCTGRAPDYEPTTAFNALSPSRSIARPKAIRRSHPIGKLTKARLVGLNCSRAGCPGTCAVSLLSGLQEGFKRLPILGKHSHKPYAIPHLRIAGNHGRGDQNDGSEGKLQIQISPDWEWIDCFDVATAQAQICGSATNRAVGSVSLYFDRHAHCYAWVFAAVIRVAVNHGSYLSLRGAVLLRKQGKVNLDRIAQNPRVRNRSDRKAYYWRRSISIWENVHSRILIRSSSGQENPAPTFRRT
jgi:hypothetical protein